MGGEIGRRNGLKIRFPATGVRVQFPPRAPSFKGFNLAVETRALRRVGQLVNALHRIRSDELVQLSARSRRHETIHGAHLALSPPPIGAEWLVFSEVNLLTHLVRGLLRRG